MAEAVPVARPRKPKQGNLIANENISIWVLPRDPWYKVRKYPRILHPWARLRYGWEYIRRNYPNTMYRVTLAFKQVAEATAGWERWTRRETIAKALKGKDFNGKPRPKGRKPTEEDIRKVITMVTAPAKPPGR
jgi:hypothetical protein